MTRQTYSTLDELTLNICRVETTHKSFQSGPVRQELPQYTGTILVSRPQYLLDLGRAY